MKKPSLSTILRGLLHVFAGIGALFCLFLIYGVCTYPHDGPIGYVGKDCRKSTAYHYLPLPEQADEHMPMALDEYWGPDYSGVIIFRATPEWQERLCRFYPREEWTESYGGMPPNADKVSDRRIADFIRSHSWTEFHQGRIGNSSTFFKALRDATSTYIMVEFFLP